MAHIRRALGLSGSFADVSEAKLCQHAMHSGCFEG